MKCNIDTIVNNRAWCNDCGKIHAGHALSLSQDESERGERWRNNRKGKRNWLRPPRIAMTCIHLDQHKLSNTEARGMEEIAKKLDTSCRGCDGNTSLQKCHGGGGHDGYTTVSYCTNKCETLFTPPDLTKAN